tara:strand:- start:199 stop:402 length:204 start_codon:yes stop_codon:yes gene_type:complete
MIHNIREEMYRNSLILTENNDTLEEQIIGELLSYCEANSVDDNTKEGVISLVSNNFKRERLRRKNRL